MHRDHTTHIEISKSAYRHNLKFIEDVIGNAQLSVVVKGNAYGHGIDYLIPLAEECGVNHFSVFSADEAMAVHQALNHNQTIMIMGMLTEDQLEWAIRNEVEFFVFEWQRLQHATKIAERLQTKARIHVEVETGMNRTGFDEDQLSDVFEYINQHSNFIEWVGLCTHLAGAESIGNYYRIQRQKRQFRKAQKLMGLYPVMARQIHAACSAATLRYPETIGNLARVGILQYGFFPSPETYIDYLSKHQLQHSPLRRIISWKSQVMSVKRVGRGEFIGYGTSYYTNTDMETATIPVGYSQGFSRSLSNQGRVLIRGQFAPVMGMVNMNMITVDITHVEGVEIGDEVVLIGNQDDREITVSSFSDFSDQVNYELLTRLPSRIPRVVVD